MQINNFDQSSTGLNITVSAFRDTDSARFLFEEAFFTIKEGRKEQLVYCEGNFGDFEKEYSFTKAELLTAWSKVESKADFLENFRGRMGFGYSKATKQDLIDYCETETGGGSNWLEFQEEAGFKPNFDIVVSCGYCQGDYKEVIVPHKFWDCIGVKKPDCVQSSLGERIDNLLWDCPIYCRFKVNEKEYCIDQELANGYNWDKAEALEIAAKLIKDGFINAPLFIYTRLIEEQVTIVNFLASALKNDLDYQ